MKDARILVATDVASDADLVKELLRDEFEHINVSTDPNKAVDDFDFIRPAVLILAFNTLEKAERYYLGLYRLSAVVQSVAHRTLILCNREELRRVYELCRKEYFDDYVLFWPVTNDVQRLPMAVTHALRDPKRMKGNTPAAGLDAAVKPLLDLKALAENSQPLVLVVDDDEFERNLIGEMLSRARYAPLFAANGGEALGLLRKLRPDLVLMDMEMPGISGLETLRRLKASPRLADIPVMMITGHSGKDVVVECLGAGATDFVVKPLERAAFLGKIAKILAVPEAPGTMHS